MLRVLFPDCDYEEWTAWSGCSEECGQGVKERTRLIRYRPENGGKSCDHLYQETDCFQPPCPGGEPRNTETRKHRTKMAEH